MIDLLHLKIKLLCIWHKYFLVESYRIYAHFLQVHISTKGGLLILGQNNGFLLRVDQQQDIDRIEKTEGISSVF
jgi:hypothetical protein